MCFISDQYDSAEVVHAGGRRRRPGSLGHGPMGVPSDHERGGHTGRAAFVVNVDLGEVFGVVSQLNAPADQGRVYRVVVAFHGDRGGAGHPAGDRPAERFSQPVGVGLAVRAAALEPADRQLPGLGMSAPVGDLLSPRREQVVEGLETVDALMAGLGDERFADVAVQPLLLAPAFGRVGLGVDHPDPQHGAGAGQPGVAERGPLSA